MIGLAIAWKTFRDTNNNSSPDNLTSIICNTSYVRTKKMIATHIKTKSNNYVLRWKMIVTREKDKHMHQLAATWLGKTNSHPYFISLRQIWEYLSSTNVKLICSKWKMAIYFHLVSIYNRRCDNTSILGWSHSYPHSYVVLFFL